MGQLYQIYPPAFLASISKYYLFLLLLDLEVRIEHQIKQYPVEAYLKIFDSSDIAPLPRPGPPRRLRRRHGPSQYIVRRKFARIQLLNTGVLNPTSELAQRSQHDPNMLPGPVPIVIRLEPLLFGVLPQSLVPTVYAILAAVVVGIAIARAVVRRLQEDVQDYSKSRAEKDSKKDR